MPVFKTLQWNNYTIRLVPSDDVRNFVREIFWRRWDVVPYFYGELSFDLAIAIPKKKYSIGEEITYDWNVCTSKDGKSIKRGGGIMPLLSNKPYKRNKIKPDDITYYPLELSYRSFTFKRFRKIKAIDLGHFSNLDQYKVLMKFGDKAGNSIQEITMLEFTLQDRDVFSINIILLIIGAIIGAVFTVIGGIIGYIFHG